MAILQTIVVGILLLGALIFVHELGHFLVAKAFKVKVLKFSLGFGKTLWGFRRGETEYVVAALPLGGFVKMAGEDPTQPVAPEDRGRGFLEQAPWKRALIAFAGPAVNLILPPLVFAALYMSPQQQSPPVVGFVLPNEPAEAAGVRPGDRVVSIDGLAIRSFEEMREAIEKRGGRAIPVVVERDGERLSLVITPSRETEENPIETTKKGKIGIVGGRMPPLVAVQPGSRAAAAGVRTFDRVISVNGKPIADSVQLRKELAKAPADAPLALGVVRDERPAAKPGEKREPLPTDKPTHTLTVAAGAAPPGLESPDMYVGQVPESSPLWKAGMRPGDKIVALNGAPVSSRFRLEARLHEERLVASPHAVTLAWEHEGERREATYTPGVVTRHDRLIGPVKTLDLGFDLDRRLYAFEPNEETVTVSYPVGEAFSRGFDKSVELVRAMGLAIAGLFTSKVPLSTIGGPVQIFQLAGESARQGLAAFLGLFAFISINLGLMNLLPIPVLDGFHILVSGVEGISRRPVPLRVREIASYVGVAMLLALMMLALGNDILRVFRAS